jgi:serine/threonine protein kinase
MSVYLPKYKIVRQISPGEIANLYEAEHEILGYKVVVKVFNSQLSANQEFKNRFINEAKVMASLNHSNIQKILDFDIQEDQLSLIMQYFEGTDLDNLIKSKGKLSDNEVQDILLQSLSALKYAHEKEILHYNLKPSNIFLTQDGEVKILNFGISNLTSSFSNLIINPNSTAGNSVYLSPEQVKGEKQLDSRTDLYSLGVCVHSLLNGSAPYNHKLLSQFEILNKIVFEPLPLISKNQVFNQIISKACQKDRDLRYQSCVEWIKEISLSEKENDLGKIKPEKNVHLHENHSTSDKGNLKNIDEQTETGNSQPQLVSKEKHTFSSKAEMLGYYIGKNISQNPIIREKTKGESKSFKLDRIVFVVTLFFILSYLIYAFFGNYPVDGYRNYFEKFFNPGIVNIRNNDEPHSYEEKIEEEIEIEDESFVLDENRYDEETNLYFDEIVMYNEFSKKKRSEPYIWTTDMKIYVDGEKEDYLIDELHYIVEELNFLIDKITISIVSSPSEANYKIYIGSRRDFARKYTLDNPERLNKNWGYFYVKNDTGFMYVDTYRNGDKKTQKHLLREELTQSLGFFNDSWKYPESIFYQGWTSTTKYAEIDEKLIDLLYGL